MHEQAGAVLLRQADRMPGLTDRAAKALTDTRRKASCRYSLLTMVRQRVYALALGYEDLNDHDEPRSDPALQTAVDADGPLAGASTLCRLEQGMGREDAVRPPTTIRRSNTICSETTTCCHRNGAIASPSPGL